MEGSWQALDASSTVRGGPLPLRLRYCTDGQLVEFFCAGRDDASAAIDERYRARLVHRRCVDELRGLPPAAPDVFAVSRQPSRDTAAVAARRGEVERLFQDLRALPELQRSALVMREVQRLSHAKLAELLDVNVVAGDHRDAAAG